jgi:hypothetical protein
MSLGITWFTLEEAAVKYCLEESLILKWIEEGVIRTDQSDSRVVRINIDDLDLKVREIIGI